jgi:hypothetical protein
MMSSRRLRLIIATVFGCLAPAIVWAVTENFDTFILATSGASTPLGSGDHCVLIQGGVTKNIACNVFATLADSQTFSNKTISGANNPLTVRGNLDIINQVPPANGGTGLATGPAGGGAILCNTAATTYAFSTVPAANAPMTWGGAGACPGAGSFTGNTTKSVSSTGSPVSGQGGSWDANGNWVPNANAMFTNVSQTITAHQTFTGGGRTKIRTQSGASDTLDTSTANTSDCGNDVLYTSTTQVTVTLPATGTPPCKINLEQGTSSGRVVPVCAVAGCGNGGGSTSPQNPQGFTGTFNGATATITVGIDANAGGSAAHWVLTGNGQ